MTITRIDPNPRMSAAVVHGDTVYLAGQVADDTSGNVAAQTKDILAKIDHVLGDCGSHKSKLLSATIYLADISTFAEMNAVWDHWVDPKNTPARATIEAKLATSAYWVEIMVIAAK